jgi:hypothetical protein
VQIQMLGADTTITPLSVTAGSASREVIELLFELGA